MINRIIALLMFVSISFSQDIFFDTDFEKYAEEEMRWLYEFDMHKSEEKWWKKHWNKNPINFTKLYNQAIDEGYDFHQLYEWIGNVSEKKLGYLSGRAYILDDEDNLFAQGFLYEGKKRGKWKIYYPPNEDGIQNLHLELHYLQVRPPSLKKKNTQRFIDEINLQKKKKVNDLQKYSFSCARIGLYRYDSNFDGDFFKYDIDGELVVKGNYTTDFNYDEDIVRIRLKPGGGDGRSGNYVECTSVKWKTSTKLNSYYHKSVNYVNNFNQNEITPDPLKDFDTFYIPIFKEIEEQKKQEEQKRRQEEQKRRQERKSREFNGPCDTYKLREWLEFSSRITYGDRFHSVEVSSPSSSGYVDYTVIIWKRSSGLDYKFGRTSCSEINQLR